MSNEQNQPQPDPKKGEGFQIAGSPESREIAPGVWARELTFQEPIADVQWSPDGKWLAVLTADRQLILLDRSLKRIRNEIASLGTLEAFCFDPDDSHSMLWMLSDSKRGQLLIPRMSLAPDSLLDVCGFLGEDQLIGLEDFFTGPSNLLLPLIPRVVVCDKRIALTNGRNRILTLGVNYHTFTADVNCAEACANISEIVFLPWDEQVVVATANGLEVWDWRLKLRMEGIGKSFGPFPLLAWNRAQPPSPLIIGTRLSRELCAFPQDVQKETRAQTHLDWLSGLQMIDHGTSLLAAGTRRTNESSTTVLQIWDLNEVGVRQYDIRAFEISQDRMNRGGVVGNPVGRQCALLWNDHWQIGEPSKILLLEFDSLIHQQPNKSGLLTNVMYTRRYTSAKIVLLGDSGAGKSTLGGQLAEGKFQHYESTHGQQFWRVDDLAPRDSEHPGIECETVLWDLAGQADYRLIHALHIEDADLAIIVFNPSDHRDPLDTAEYWLQQLPPRCRRILVANKIDRGWGELAPDDLDQWCRTHAVSGGWLATAANYGEGVDELRRRITVELSDSQRPHIIEGQVYYQIRQQVLAMKEQAQSTQLDRLETVLEQLRSGPAKVEFTIDEVRQACRHLERNGFVRVLTTSKGEERLLLDPTLVNNLAASFILEARRNQRGLGALEEDQLLNGGYRFPELEGLPPEDRQYLVEAVVELFLQRRLSYRCFREILGATRLLVFPELMNLKKPNKGLEPVEETVAYTVEGATENLYASLVVRLGYTNVFESSNQWQNEARYSDQKKSICGFRQQVGEGGVREFYLLFGPQVPQHTRQMFQGLFESFLDPQQLLQEGGRSVTIQRWPRVECSQCHTRLDWNVQRKFQSQGFTFCHRCGLKVEIPRAAEPIVFTHGMEQRIEAEVTTSRLRTTFEQALYRLKSLVAQRSPGVTQEELGGGLAWGVSEEERWVEQFVEDLEKAGFQVWFDRQHNAAPGKSIARFVERLSDTPRILVVGTPGYLRKHFSQGNVVSAEMDLINQRFIGTKEADKETIIPLLISGSEVASFPPFLRKRVYVDFRQQSHYFERALDLFLQLHDVPTKHPAFREWRDLFKTEAQWGLVDEGDGGEEAGISETPEALRAALHRMGGAAAEAASSAGHPLSVWKNGQVVTESAAESRPQRSTP